MSTSSTVDWIKRDLWLQVVTVEYCSKQANKFYLESDENRVSKHSVIFLNFPSLIVCLLCCLFMSFCFVFFFACFVVRDLCRSGCRQDFYLTSLYPSFPPYFFLSLPTILSLIQMTLIRNQCAPKTSFGAV